MRVVNISQKTLIGDKIDIARTESQRRLGLIPRNSLKSGEGLIIAPCNSIHMYNMKFPIDVLFVDKYNQIVYILENFMPQQVSGVIDRAQYVVELPVGTLRKSYTKIGDFIHISLL